MQRVRTPSVKELKEFIEALRVEHGSTLKPAPISEIERIYGIPRGNLANWVKDSVERDRIFKFIEDGRKDLGWDEAKTYKKVIKGGRK